MCFLEESNKKMQKIQILKIYKALPLYEIRQHTFNNEVFL